MPSGAALTERFEDAVAGLIVGFCVRLVGGRLRRRHPLLPLLVAGPPAVTSPSSIALGHPHADVDGVVTYGDTGTESSKWKKNRLTEEGEIGAGEGMQCYFRTPSNETRTSTS